jgi:hypothetical protein
MFSLIFLCASCLFCGYQIGSFVAYSKARAELKAAEAQTTKGA